MYDIQCVGLNCLFIPMEYFRCALTSIIYFV